MDEAPATKRAEANLPPGSLGLPWIGETLPFIRDPFGFLSKRYVKYGPIFRTRILGETVICLTGPDAIRFFYDPQYFTRENASFPQLRELLHPNAIPFLDHSPAHTGRRQLLLQAFAPEALAGYIPFVERVVRRYLTQWERKGSFLWVPELRAMCFDIANTLFTGASPDSSEPRAFDAFTRMSAGFVVAPIKLPFTKYGRALTGRDELRAYIHERVGAPPETGAADVLSRLRAARTPSGVAMGSKEIEIETLHLFFGAFAVITGALVNVGIALAEHPDVRDRLRQEVTARTPAGPLDLLTLNDLPYLTQFSKEIRRFYRLVPSTFFARARQDCEHNGYRIAVGTKALGCLRETMQDTATFSAPGTFDPDRFSPQRAEDEPPNTFVPHGAGPWDGHRCAGQKLAELMMQIYTTLLIRDYTWELPTPDSTRSPGELVPTPRNGLPTHFARTAG